MTCKYRISALTLAVFALLLIFSLSASAQNGKTVEELVKKISGDTLKVETKAVPFQITGDFNGDKIKDVAVIVSLSGTVANIGKKVKIEYPYYSKEVLREDLALLIIHGDGKGWQTAQKNSILFLGGNAALIFQTQRLGESGENGGNWEIEKTRGGKTNLFFATEGSDGTLKWNGKKYVWTESNP